MKDKVEKSSYHILNKYMNKICELSNDESDFILASDVREKLYPTSSTKYKRYNQMVNTLLVLQGYGYIKLEKTSHDYKICITSKGRIYRENNRDTIVKWIFSNLIAIIALCLSIISLFFQLCQLHNGQNLIENLMCLL